MAKKEKKSRNFESEALILPPLKMILAEGENLSQPAPKKKQTPDIEQKEELVRKLIKRLSRPE